MIAAAPAMMIPARIPDFPSGSPLLIAFAPAQIFTTPHRNPNMKSTPSATPKLSFNCWICASGIGGMTLPFYQAPFSLSICEYANMHALPMHSALSEKRISVSLSRKDDEALARLLSRLLPLGVSVSPRRLIAGLAHAYTESEMEDHVRRYLRTTAGAGDAPSTVHRPSVTLLGEDVRKLKKVRLNLMKGHAGWIWEIDLLRAYWMLPSPVVDLAKRLVKFDRDYPDKRTLAGRRTRTT